MESCDYRTMKDSSPSSRVEKPYRSAASYRDYVEVLCSRNPCLLNLLSFLSSTKGFRKSCQVTALDFRQGINHPITRPLLDVDYLPQELSGNLKPVDKLEEQYYDHPLQGRILIIEDLTKDVVELLGSNLDIDPLFFALHLHTTQRNDMRSQAPDEAILPSRLVSQDYINTAYHRPLVCDTMPPFGERLVRDMVVNRKLVFIHSKPIGLAQHCVSVIKFQQGDGLWIGMFSLRVDMSRLLLLTSLALLLVDPPISDSYYPSDKKDNEALKLSLPLRPYLGIYEDFIDPPKFSDDWAHLDESSRGGMASELIQCWERTIPANFNPMDPSLESLAYYPLRIVAAEWVKYVAVMQHCVKMYEYRGDRLPSLEQFNMDLKELQGWRRRSMMSQQKVRSVIRQLKSRQSLESKGQSYLQHLIEDFEVINYNIKHAGRTLENMLPVVTSLVQIIDARQSFAETANISRLTILALVFVPLSYISSLFSMNESNKPGGPDFWVYFAVAVPVTFLVFLAARLPTRPIQGILEWIRGLEWISDPGKRRMSVSRTSHKATMKDKSEA